MTMGCFDTFEGKVKCPICGRVNEFQEQTKAYACLLNYFKLGDYIDETNTTYVYVADKAGDCDCGAYDVHIVIKNGQVIGFFNEDDMKAIDIDKLENIEDGLARRLERDERVKVSYGFDDTNLFSRSGLNVGDTVTILDDLWHIEEVYKEELTQDNGNCQTLYELWYKDNFVYLVHNNKGVKRMLVTRENDLDWLYDINLEAADFSTEACENQESYNRIYTIQYGCLLKKLK